MFISADGPTRSIRAHPLEGGELLIVGGEGHKVGQGGDTRERYERLEAFAREHFDVSAIDYRWSSQDNMTADGVPYVGALTPVSKRVLYATGFAKWGLTNGAAAGADARRPPARPREPLGRRPSTPTGSSRSPRRRTSSRRT